MPKSRARKRKPVSARRRSIPDRGRPDGAAGYVPSQLPEDDEGIDRLLAFPAEHLHTAGLALWHLLSTPDRRSYQCLAASVVLEMVMRTVGIEARTVALTIEVPWAADGRGVLYGDPSPVMRGSKFNGHAGLLVDGLLLDPTALQFPELRAQFGPVPFAVPVPDVERVAEAGAEVRIRLDSNREITYRVLPADEVADSVYALLSSQMDALESAANNLLITYAVFLSQLPDEKLAKVHESSPRLSKMALAARSLDVRFDDDGRASWVAKED